MQLAHEALSLSGIAESPRPAAPGAVDLVAIGISTGGPQALRYLIPQLPEDFPVPLAVVLHMPVGYTEMYAKRLDEISRLRVVEAREGDEIRAGTVYLERAEGASLAKSEFMAAMSHELRTPLGAIIGYSDLLETEVVGPLTERQKDHMRRVKTGAYHLLGIIEEILTFSRLDAGREPVHAELVDASSIAADAVVMVEPQAAQKGLPLRLQLPEHPVPVSTDAGKLRQILVNLLGNAVKFTDAGQVELRVWSETGKVHFQVSDTGPGIAPEDLDRIFEPFTQVDSSHTRVKGGTGLGLPVSRRIARLLGGEPRVDSAPGRGSRFTLSLPSVAPET